MPETCIPATRTVRLRIAPSAHQSKLAALEATMAEWDRAVAFYTGLFLSHPGVFAARKTEMVRTGPDAGKTREVPWTDKDRLSWAESVTIPLAAHPDVVPDRNFVAVCPGCPADLGRAAIHAAMGAVQSFLSNLRRWGAADPKRRGKRPKPPSPHPHPTACGPMAQVCLADYGAGFVRLKVKAGGRWEWINLAVQAPPHFDALLQECERSNAGLWRPIAGLHAAVAWRVAAAIVTWAVVCGLPVLVFEHLRAYRPERGLSWSRRTNRKRSYWLRGKALKLLKDVRHLAACQGILVVERNPAWISQACPRCSRLGEGFSPSGRGYGSCFRCGRCAWTDGANIVAALGTPPRERPPNQDACERQAQPRAERAHRRRWGLTSDRGRMPLRPHAVGRLILADSVVRLVFGSARVRKRLAARGAGRFPARSPA